MTADQIGRATFWGDAILATGAGLLLFAVCTAALLYLLDKDQ
jgi:hypothetical protein